MGAHLLLTPGPRKTQVTFLLLKKLGFILHDIKPLSLFSVEFFLIFQKKIELQPYSTYFIIRSVCAKKEKKCLIFLIILLILIGTLC